MAGYANRTLMLDFPDLSEEGDNVHIVIKNPRMVPLHELQPADVPTNADGTPVDDTAATTAMFKVFAALVKAWHVYDATDDGDDQALLPLPATPETVAKLPMEIQKRLIEEVTKVTNAGGN